MNALRSHQLSLFISLLVISSLLVALEPAQLYAQYIPRSERADPTLRRRDDVEANRLRTSLFNFGFAGRTGAGQGIPFEWPKHTGRVYIALSTMFIGGEVVDANNQTIHIVSVPAYRQSPTGQDWNINPVPGYANPSTIAHSDNPATWPPFWPDKLWDTTDPGWAGSWNGLLGKNAFINGTEFYYHISDDRYARYQFYPDSTDTTRRGLGIVVSQRVLEWKETFLEDAIVTISDIYNVGDNTITNAAVTFWVADFVGGDGDSQDDKIIYDLDRRVLYFTDADGISCNPAFACGRVDMPTLVFLQVPTTHGPLQGITNAQYQPAGTINFSTTPDEFFWQTFMVPGSFVDTNAIATGEYDLFASCGLFVLPAGGFERVVTATVFGKDRPDDLRKIEYLKSLVAGGYVTNSVNVSINSPTPGQIVSGQVPVQWSARGNDPSLKIDIFFSTNSGDNWKILASGETNDGSYLWDTDTLDDGIFYKLQIVAYDSMGIGYRVMDSTFTLNNPASAPPQLRVNTPQAGGLYQSQAPIQWIAGDPDGDTVYLNLHYRIQGFTGWMPIATAIPNNGSYQWNVIALPNSQLYSLTVEAFSRGETESDTVGLFEIRNQRYRISDSAFTQRNTIGTGLIEPHIADTSLITGHTYSVEFSVDSNVTRYDVIDQNTGLPVVDDATEVQGTIEGPLFDGIRLLIRNDSLHADTSRSGWNHSDVYSEIVKLFRAGFVVGLPTLEDYILQIGDVGIDTSTTFMVGSVTFPARAVNFRISKMATSERVPFGFAEFDGNDGRFTAGLSGTLWRSDVIVLLSPDPQDSLVPSWQIALGQFTTGRNPEIADTLLIYFFIPFQTGDQYWFQALLGPPLGMVEQAPERFALYQNYPNPFNPQTTIRFSVGSLQHVRLEIYDILGRKIRSLVDERLSPGNYSIIWDGKNEKNLAVASGVYFYRLRAGHFAVTKKLLLIR